MAIRDLSIYEKQMLWGVFSSLYLAIRDLAILQKAGPWRVYIVRSLRRVQCPSF